MKDLSKTYKLSDQGDLSWYLGISINHDREKGILTMGQEKYIDMLLDRFAMAEATTAPTPFEAGTRLLKEHCPNVQNPEQIKAYQQIVGGLMWVSTLTRPDITFAVNQCAKFMSNPGPVHVQAAKRILRYLKGSKELCLTYRRDTPDPNTIIAYADADHAGDPDTRRSVTGYVLMMNGGAIAWQSTRQHVTALSTAEAEYYSKRDRTRGHQP